MTQPGPHPWATETPGHSFGLKPGCKPSILRKHLLHARPVLGATTPAFLSGLGEPQVGLGGNAEVSLGNIS